MGAWIETCSFGLFNVINSSHPTWVRGLKLISGNLQVEGSLVAPYVGAWIETLNYDIEGNANGVAPYVGAWIETRQPTRKKKPTRLSHPTWVRGLKRSKEWWDAQPKKSHPTWVRGLKHGGGEHIRLLERSHPTWVRGLKLMATECNECPHAVAPYVGAWIETLVWDALLIARTRRTLRGCVD